LARIGPNGLQLFDSSNGLKAKDITSLLEDREGAIWVATAETGLARIRGRQVTSFRTNEGLENEAIHCLVEPSNGTLLAGSHGGLFQRRGDRFERVPLPEPWLAGHVAALAAEDNGWVWIGSRKGSLARWNGSRLEEIAMPPEAKSQDILGLKVDSAGQLWVLQTERLLKRTRDGNWSVVTLPGMPSVVVFTGLAIDRNGDLILLLGPDGLYLRSTDGSHRFLNASSLPCRDSIICAIRDRNGSLWIGTNGDYLWTQPFQGLASLTRHPETGTDLGLGTVVSFLELPGKRMLMGSNNGVFLWDEKKGLVQQWKRRDGLVSEEVWALQTDEQGGAWVGTMKGLHRLGSAGRLLPGPQALQKAHIECLTRTADRLWAGTSLGLAELDSKGRFLALFNPLEAVGYPEIHCVVPRESDLLVGTSLGLYSFKNGVFSKAFPGNPTDKQQILALHLDASHRLWVGTSQSLLLREPENGTWMYPDLEAAGQPLYGITWIRRLSTGTLAIGHAKGVTLVSPDGKPFHLTRRMGLISDETNQAAALEDRQGRLWMGMVGGVCILDRLEAFPKPPPLTPVVLDVTWERGSFWYPKEVTLPRGFTNLAVHVDVGSPNAPFPLLYEARLEETGAPWQPMEPGLGRIYYGGLSYGTHRLRFRASLDGSSWLESEPVVIGIQPPWFLTIWARGALVTLVVLGCLVLVQLRLRRLEQNNRDLEAKVQARTRELEGRTHELALQNQSMEWIHRELRNTLESRMGMINTVSHDLRSPLTSILLSVDRLQHLSTEIDPKVLRIFGVLAHEAKRLDAIIKAVLDRNRGDSLADQLSLKLGSPRVILDNLEATLTLKAESRGLQSSLSLDPASLEVAILLDSPAMQQVLFNLVENALKFTQPPGKVGVRSSICGPDWVLEVWDTGRGIPKHHCERLFNPFEQGSTKDAQKGWGLGLYICRSIVEAHRGRIEVESIVDKGSEFRVMLPIVQPETTPSLVTDVETILQLSPGPAPGTDALGQTPTGG
jgi:signal transduction histidine kinase/ligand-binding sensor domain-containing protein